MWCICVYVVCVISVCVCDCICGMCACVNVYVNVCVWHFHNARGSCGEQILSPCDLHPRHCLSEHATVCGKTGVAEGILRLQIQRNESSLRL